MRGEKASEMALRPDWESSGLAESWGCGARQKQKRRHLFPGKKAAGRDQNNTKTAARVPEGENAREWLKPYNNRAEKPHSVFNLYLMSGV